MGSPHDTDNASRCDQSETVNAKAEEWVVIMTAPSVPVSDKRAFKSWYTENEHNKAAYDAAIAEWYELPFEAAAEHIPKSAPAFSTSRFRFRQMLMPVAATIFIVLIIAGLLQPYQSGSSQEMASYRTQVGEKQVITLPDDSIVTLNTNSHITVSYTENYRRIDLLHGEALFNVTKARDKPFLVNTHNGIIRVTGTVFSVTSYTSDKTAVAVEHGSVKVQVKERKWSKAILKGDQLIEITGNALGQITQVDSEAYLAWQNGWLVFDRTPLHQVVAQLQTYSASQISIDASDIAELPISGSFSARDVEAVLRGIEHVHPIKVTVLDNGQVKIAKK